jgi:hypothetical protein
MHKFNVMGSIPEMIVSRLQRGAQTEFWKCIIGCFLLAGGLKL